VYWSCGGSENCGMEHAVLWRGVMYLGTKLGREATQLDVIQFVSVLQLKLLGCFESILLTVYRQPMGLYRNKINEDQIRQELLSTLAHLSDC
jgi:hypothetical protein